MWHKVENNDLPTKTGDYLVVYKSGTYAVLRYCVEDVCNDTLNLQKGFNNFDKEMFEYYPALGVIAWTELPKYKE